jgi:hypothetical protein
MNYRSTDGLSLCSAAAIDLAISTGYPVGFVAAVAMPIACADPWYLKTSEDLNLLEKVLCDSMHLFPVVMLTEAQ